MNQERALGALPLIDAAFCDGDLSYSKVRALTRAATPDNEADLLERARHASAEGVEQLVRRVKQNECLDNAQAMIRSRALSTRRDESGMLIVHVSAATLSGVLSKHTPGNHSAPSKKTFPLKRFSTLKPCVDWPAMAA